MPREYYLLPSLPRPLTRNVKLETGWISNSNTNATTLSHDGSHNSLLIAPNPKNRIARVCFRVWIRVSGQSLGPLSGVWVRVSGPNLGQSLESEFKVKGLSLESEFASEFGWVKVWSQSLESRLESGSEFGPESGVWGPSPSLGTQSQTLKWV